MQPTTQGIGTENHPEMFMHLANLRHFPIYPFRAFGFSGNFRCNQLKPGDFFFLFCHVCPMKSEIWEENDSWNLTWENVFREGKAHLGEKTIYLFFWCQKFSLQSFWHPKCWLFGWGVFSSLRAFGRLEFSSMVFGCLGEDGWYVDGLEIRPLHRLRWRNLPVFYRVSLISQVVNAGFLEHQQYLLDSKMFGYHFS